MSDSPSNYFDGSISEYELKLENPGLVYIFNNQAFLNDETRKEKLLFRNGSNSDVENLEKLFKEMNFTVEKFIDYKAFGMRKIIEEITTKTDYKMNFTVEKFIDYKAFGMRKIIEEITTKTDYTNVDSVIVFIMSHGHKDEFGNHHILTYDEQYVNVDEFIEPFKNVDSLKKKPKLFFIEASRGNYIMPTIEDVKKNEQTKLANDTELGVDFAISHSTIDNCISIGSIVNGSWYIQSLCKMIKERGNRDDFSSIMTKVNNHMQQREYRGNDKKLYKMLPTCSCRLSKCFKFPKQLMVIKIFWLKLNFKS